MTALTHPNLSPPHAARFERCGAPNRRVHPSRAAVLGVLVRSIGHSNPLIGHQVPRHADPSGIE